MIVQMSTIFKYEVLGQFSLDPLKSAIMDRKVVPQRPILAGSLSWFT